MAVGGKSYPKGLLDYMGFPVMSFAALPKGYIILFHEVDEWEWHDCNEAEAREHATRDKRHMNYGHRGYTLIYSPTEPKPIQWD